MFNILPRSIDEYNSAKALYMQWAKQISSMGGSVAAEHGIGKLKVPFLREMYSSSDLAQMHELKHSFDSEDFFNKGNILGAES